MIARMASDQESEVDGRIFQWVVNRVSLMNSPAQGRSCNKDRR